MRSTRNEARFLGSWKEIAAYLGKGVRTVQRWEQEVGLPVSRPEKAHKGVVLARQTNWINGLPRPGRKDLTPTPET
jgi:hypothetical protein